MINFLSQISEYAVYFVLIAFIVLLVYFFSKVNYVNKNLKALVSLFKSVKKEELTVKFKLLDAKLVANSYINVVWNEFKSTLFFPETVTEQEDTAKNFFNSGMQPSLSIQTTIDPEYFFNEDSLIASKYNSKLVSIIPTILTGLGPLFTFLAIATAFAHINFSSQEDTITTVSSIMHSMQMAALVSVSALAASITFMFLEKIVYELRCKNHLLTLQSIVSKLFDSTSSEKFLVELLRQNRAQSRNLAYVLQKIPEQFKVTVNETFNSSLVPYLESIVFGLNKIREYSKDISRDGRNDDIPDDLI